MSNKYDRRVLKVLVGPVGEPIFAEGNFEVAIDDLAAGEFVTVTSLNESENQTVGIAAEEWPVLREAIDLMINDCRSYE